MKNKLFAIIALLLAFSLIFAGCTGGGQDDRKDDEWEELHDRDEEKDNKDDGKNADKNDDQNEEQNKEEENEKEEPVLPVYETREIWLCVRMTREMWDGSGTSETEYEYDEFGNKVSENHVTYGGGSTFEYDEYGNVTSSRYVAPTGSYGTITEMTYDASGNVLTKVSKGLDQKLSSEYTYTYDEAGFVVDEVQKQHYNNTEYHYVITYNADHTEATIQSYQNEQSIGYTNETYNQNGDLLRSDSYAADGTWKSAVACEYDTQGRISVEWHYSSSELQADYDVIYTYDENGLLVDKNVDYYYGYGDTYEYEQFEIKVRVN